MNQSKSVFADYARYYNLLYRDKDYRSETDFVLKAMRAHGCQPGTLLDLGCGTGRHAVEMARSGVQVTGVDMSETMLDMGRRHLASLKPDDFPVSLPELHHGDARTVRLDRKFDAVTSLFHVMSYQTTEQDALAMFVTVREHLAPGGVFFFDFWYGPGVLRELPERREKILKDEYTCVRRLAVPEHRVADNVIDVHYEVALSAPGQQENEVFLREKHSMRYWFVPELRFLADQAGFTTLSCGGWMHDDSPGLNDWNAWMLLKA